MTTSRERANTLLILTCVVTVLIYTGVARTIGLAALVIATAANLMMAARIRRDNR